MQPGSLNPAALLPGTYVGPWRIVDVRGGGAFGTVYLAKGEAPEATGFVALKLALRPLDARFGREVELLSRIRHPAVPRLIAQGLWQASPEGLPHPYLVMEWIEGVPLYEWARVHAPSSRQVLQLLARLARALEATHAAGGVHRDVKGENVLARMTDGQAFLTDFGAGSYQEADRLTWQAFPPGTRAYRAPEAIRAMLPPLKVPVMPYAPGPGDDLFALGVTAYRLVTGQYPPTADPLDEGAHVWQEDGTGPQPARELNPSCLPELSQLISWMLSLHPEARGTARELAEALEQTAQAAGPDADASLFSRSALPPMEVEATSQRGTPRVPHRRCQPWLAAAIAGPVLLGAAWALSMAGTEEAAQVHVAEEAEARDAGIVAVGNSVLTAPVVSAQAPSTWLAIGMELPSRPLPGQVRPDVSGRCASKSWVPINGGCWMEAKGSPKECDEYSYAYKGACYQPVYPPPRPGTSGTTDSPDGGD